MLPLLNLDQWSHEVMRATPRPLAYTFNLGQQILFFLCNVFFCSEVFCYFFKKTKCIGCRHIMQLGQHSA